MLTVVLTFTGLVMLMKICQPMNLVRAALFVSIVAACVTVLAVPYLGGLVVDGWRDIEFNASQILLLIVIIQAAIPLSSGLIKFFDLFNPADE